MSTINLEQRVEALEAQYAELLQMFQDKPRRNGWRKVVGMFVDDPLIEDLHKETQRIREEDRSENRDGNLAVDQGDTHS